MLWTSGMDGSVRVWRNYACPGEESLVAAVRALPLPALSACVDRQINLNRGLDRVGLKQNASTGGGGGTGAPKPPLGSRGGLKETVWLAASGAAGDATDGRGGFRVDSQDASRGLRMDATDSRGPIDRDCSSRSYHDFNQHYGHPRKPRVRPAVVWQQQSGCLYASGDTYPVPLLRVWDMTRELCLESLQTQSPGTCLTAQGALLMAGALDGAVMSFDLRTPARLLSVVQVRPPGLSQIRHTLFDALSDCFADCTQDTCPVCPYSTPTLADSRLTLFFSTPRRTPTAWWRFCCSPETWGTWW